MTTLPTPKEAYAQRAVVHEELAVIAKALRQPWGDAERQRGRVINIRVSAEREPAVREALQEAGWDASFHTGQREGFLRVKEADYLS